MSDETTPDLRWLVERIDRNHRETTADIAKLEAHVASSAATFDRYVLARVYDADEKVRDTQRHAQDDRIKCLEDESKAERKRREEDASANKKILRSAVVVAVFGILSTVISGVLLAALVKSGAH